MGRIVGFVCVQQGRNVGICCVAYMQETVLSWAVSCCKCIKCSFADIIQPTSRVPVGGKSSVCLICMKYRIIILIIIIKRLGEILLSYIAHTSRTHTPLPLCGYGPSRPGSITTERREWPSTHAVSITALHGR